MKKYLVTAALPYANGPLHFGHLAGAYLPADIFVRHQRLMGQRVLFICGSDEHGVAIMLNARSQQQDYQNYVNSWHQAHRALFARFAVDFDFFGQTSAPYHQEEVQQWFHRLNAKGLIGTKAGQQLYCNNCHNHLPDRFVEGTCYQCGYAHARGDECPNCGELIAPERLIHPVCKICGSNNISEVTVNQYYLLLSQFQEPFQQWLAGKQHWRKTVYPYLESLAKDGLVDRAISRDLDWGIDVPLPEAQGKKLYVWFDAPIGYVSNTKEYLRQSGSTEDYLADWWLNPEVTITNFIGKDNIIFHGIIFPVMSLASGQVRPVDELPANQYLNLAGKQFSKSTGHYVDTEAALSAVGVDALRYYLIAIMPELSDSSFVWEGLVTKVNNELANNIGNLVSRALKFLAKNWPQGLDAKYFQNFSWGPQWEQELQEINSAIDSYQFKRALEKIMALGHRANNFFSEQAPWQQIKSDPKIAADTLAQTAAMILILGVKLQPFLPQLAEQILAYFPPGSREVIYQGKLEILRTIFADGLLLAKEVTSLVPKIDENLPLFARDVT